MNEELKHHGVKGMKWGVRKAQKYSNKARIARESADEWDEMARYAESRGKTKRAASYRKSAAKDRLDADKYDSKSASARQEVDRTKAAVKDYRKNTTPPNELRMPLTK